LSQLIERFITAFARKKNAEYLQFAPDSALTVPAVKDDKERLLYIHVPFCEELCPYCSFNRVTFKEDLARPYFEALRQEILVYADLGYDFQAIYVGGGTPTVLIDELEKTIARACERFHVREISVETNPNHLIPANLDRLVSIGVNRLSVGVQTFDDNLLKSMQRYHKYGSGAEIAERLILTQGRFNTLNVDMIFNFPTQTMEALEHDLSTILNLKVDQVTFYPLMVSDSTRELVRRRMGVVDYGRGRRYYERIVAMLSPQYHPATAWCFSRNVAMIDEYVVNYDEYAGLGSGSIGYLGGSVYANTFDVAEYTSRMKAGKPPVAARKDFSTKERFRYDFLMKLFGFSLDLDELGRKHGASALRYLWLETLFFRMVGGLAKEGSILRLTPKGQYFWVIMMREFFIGVNNFRDYCRDEIVPSS
jgi:coproporphyrinogen III oxidase-like Fe-S oxidoreductase